MVPTDPNEREIVAGLLRRQERLQAEAARVLAHLDLLNLLAPAGEATQVGSSATGLMVRPDIDVCVICDNWTVDAVFEAGRPLASHPRVRKLSFWNEAGPFQPAGLAAGYYWGVLYRADDGVEWTLDIWFWPRHAPATDIEHAAELRRRLTPETRGAILWIKDHQLHLPPGAGPRARSVDVYDAVLDHGVRTPAAFDAYLARRAATG